MNDTCINKHVFVRRYIQSACIYVFILSQYLKFSVQKLILDIIVEIPYFH